MKASDYRKKVRKGIMCPSGIELEIRKVKAIDYLRMGVLPDTLAEMGEKPEKVNPDTLDKIQKMFLTTIVIATSDFNIVDKPFNELGEGEISYLEIEDDDTNFIINEISTFSFGEKENGGGEEGIRPFSEESVSKPD